MNIYERDGKFLVIFSDIPQWLIVDAFGLGILKNMVSGDSLKQIKRKMPEDADEVETTYNELQPLINQKINRDSPIMENALTSKTTVAMIGVTRNCNLQSICPHCYVDAGGSRGKELSCKEHENLARQICNCLTPDKNKMYKVNLTGGEPFCRPDILEIIRAYKKFGLNVNMSTNGLLIKNEDIPAISEMEVVLSVSLDGASAETHDRIRGRGSWEKLIGKINKLV
jgi:MoaA/NifB/PqqE/SkfB family radical SAM enzyme